MCNSKLFARFVCNSYIMENGPLIPFVAGSPMMIAGPTGVGKTYFTHRVLTSPNMFTQPISSVLYCYGVYQPFYDQMMEENKIPNLSFHQGLPSMEDVKSVVDSFGGSGFNIIVLDDLMELIVKSIDAQNLFTKYCHHYNVTVIFLTQNVFAKGPCARTISLNTHVLVLFANKRDASQAVSLGKQLYPGRVKGFVQAYEDATLSLNPFGYLVVDCNPTSPPEIKLRTRIFPGEDTICYLL